MYKYIQDTIRNNSRSITVGMTKPQKKSFAEIVRGIFLENTPILRHLAQDETKTAKKQGEKYSYHLGNISLQERIEGFSLQRVKGEVKRNTIIAYDLTDLSKESAKKIPYLSRVFDGSEGTITNGFVLHGVGVNNMLLKIEMHDGWHFTQNQIRRRIIEYYAGIFGRKGIWVFDRGNDDKAFFKFLRRTANTQFIARLKENRQVVMKETGAILKIREIPPGKYSIYLLNVHNIRVDNRFEYTLVIHKHLEGRKPMRLISWLKDDYPSEQIVNMYLQRWGIENIFKRAKHKFNLEKIRVLNHQKFVNLICLVQFAINLSTITFINMQKLTHSLISGVYFCYQNFLKQKSLTFLKNVLKPLVFKHERPPSNQLNLLSTRSLQKLGPF
mgnify:CR=1 FL=1